MKYALLIYDVPGSLERLSEGEHDAVMGEYFAITKEPGIVGGEQLHPVETATTVRVQDGQALTTDGQIAARIPAARMGGSVEIRPVVER
jgi:hypothetical protein